MITLYTIVADEDPIKLVEKVEETMRQHGLIPCGGPFIVPSFSTKPLVAQALYRPE